MLKRLAILTVCLLMIVTVSAACNLGVSVTESVTATPQTQQMPIVYYYFASVPGNTFPAGSVVIVPDVLILSPTITKQSRSTDPALNIQSAMQSMINDPRNVWTSSGLTISNVTFNAGEATVTLNGTITGVGGAVLSAASMQFLLTVFTEPAVQSAAITLNSESIGNLGISHSSQAKPADYKYSRTEIETFMRDNAYAP